MPRPSRADQDRAFLLWPALSLVAACQFTTLAPGGAEGDDGQDVADIDAASDGRTDARPPTIDGSPDAEPAMPAHLLLTEVKTQPDTAEFIEILNPLAEQVSLRDYYLSDDPLYAQLPGYSASGTTAPVGNRDAILRFPDGAMLMPGEVAVVAVDEAGFVAEFAQNPDYALAPAVPPVAGAMERTAVGNVSLELSAAGEPIILFRWDGQSDLVTDIDIMICGDLAQAVGSDNGLPDKTETGIDGPDPDATAGTYAPDGATMSSMSYRSGTAASYKRIALEGLEEPRGAGNGIEGHDETSEQTLVTWGQMSSAPTPGEVPAALALH